MTKRSGNSLHDMTLLQAINIFRRELGLHDLFEVERLPKDDVLGPEAVLLRLDSGALCYVARDLERWQNYGEHFSLQPNWVRMIHEKGFPADWYLCGWVAGGVIERWKLIHVILGLRPYIGTGDRSQGTDAFGRGVFKSSRYGLAWVDYDARNFAEAHAAGLLKSSHELIPFPRLVRSA